MNRAGKIATKSREVHSDPGKDMADHNYDPRDLTPSNLHGHQAHM